jgi:sarcosine oxidase subunit beta
MPLALLKYGLSKRHPGAPHFARAQPPKKSYEVVIIGGGGHGLACAYYLAKDHGITDVAVIERGYIGGGNTGRNTAIVRSNYLTPEGVRFYDESLRLFERLSSELDINLMVSRRGHFTLAHSDAALRTSRWRAEVNTHLGVRSELVLRDELARMVPQLDMSDEVRYPILGALHHPPGSIVRHDALAWGYAALAGKRGVHIHQHTEVTGIKVRKGRVRGVETGAGPIRCDKVVQAVSGHSSVVARMAGIRLPITSVPLQACVSQPLKPFLDPIIVSGSLHVYVSQSVRGELVMGGAIDPYPRYQTRSTLEFKEELMRHVLALFPFLGEVRLLRQWAGVTDMTPDFSPVIGETPVENYYLDAGWGSWGFKATPVCGKRMAELVATGKVPALLEPFRLSRFAEFRLLGEKSAASVGH